MLNYIKILGIFFHLSFLFMFTQVRASTLTDFEKAHSILPPKSPKTERVWDETVKYIIQDSSIPLLVSLLKHSPESGMPTAWYRYDLLEVFKKRNQLTLENAEKTFKGNENCILYWLLPQSELVKSEEIESILKSNSSKLAKDYLVFMKANIKNNVPQFTRKNCIGL